MANPLSSSHSNNLLQSVIRRLGDWEMVLLIALLLAACTPAYADPATIAYTVEPPAIFAKLGEASSLDQGVSQFAAALNVDPKVVRIRIQPGDCLVCRVQSTPELSKVEGLSLEEAEKLVEAKDQVSLFVPKFSCIFLYDGSHLTPQSCQMSPI